MNSAAGGGESTGYPRGGTITSGRARVVGRTGAWGILPKHPSLRLDCFFSKF